ncbi:MAG TPA: TIGR03618 family F420-dependent PPOX class oxidoreductase [Dehalococcoidia bacterium]|nr:TIGR03618 family F420-dependent PPOX class oxidoreductase [Dehalococcoidia bacterium]
MSEFPEREQFLREANVAVLATVDRRSRAHAAPIWYLYEDGVFILSTGRGSQKHRNIEANPEVTLVVDRRSLPYYVVMAHGRAEIGPPLADEARLRMAVRYLGEERARAYVAMRSPDDSVSIRLRPRRLIEYHGRAGRRAG